MSRQHLKIGLFGFGCVGQGLYDVLSKSSGIKADIVKICVKDRAKQRALPKEVFTFDKDELLNNPEVNLIVELISDADEAYAIVTTALKNGKHVVTANKKMVANHFQELVELQHKHNVSLLYEASTCGSIPIIRNLEEYYDNELLNSVSGIFNGTSNFILSKIFSGNLDYAIALKQAQELGFAEADPTNDVEGFDAKFKLIIATAHAFGLFIKPEEVLNIGITTLSEYDIKFAKEKGLKIKLVPFVNKMSDSEITLAVLPQLVNQTHHLFNVENEYNGVIVEAAFSDKQLFYGKGAGGHPTGSAVLSDISAVSYDYRYEYKKYNQNLKLTYTKDVELEVYVRYTTQSDLEGIKFNGISEELKTENYGYIIGSITLAELNRVKNQLKEGGVFVASTGRILTTGGNRYQSNKTALRYMEA